MLGGVDIPEVGAGDPPALAVPEEFEAVDAAAFYVAVRGGSAFGGGEYVGNVSGALRNAVDFVFVKRFSANRSFAGIHKFLVAHGYGGRLAGSVFADDNEADVGNI